MKKFIVLLIITVAFYQAYCQKNNTDKKQTADIVLEPHYIDNDNVLFLPKKTVARRNTSANQRNQQPQQEFPAKAEAYISFEKGSAYYTKGGLNALDSLYMITFNKNNDKFYKMTIEGYDDGEPVTEQTSSLARERAVMVFKYFASREETEYIIKRTPSSCFISCEGEKEYYIKYKMPFDFKWINLNNYVQQERLSRGIDLCSKVHIIIEDDPEDCLGEFYDYDWPSENTMLNGNFGKVEIPRGNLAYIHHTKDSIPYECVINYKEVLSFEDLTGNYFLIPHKKQYIINGGYIVVSPNKLPDWNTCAGKDTVQALINVEVFLEEQQQKAGLKFFAKTYKPNGEVVYKAVSTKKNKNKDTGEYSISCQITPFQFDTIYIGKKIEQKEMSDYFYPATESDPGAFEAMGGWLKPYKLDKKGEYVIKDAMKMILRKPNGSLSY